MTDRYFLEKQPLIRTEHLCLHSFYDVDSEDVVDLLCNDEIKQTFILPDFEFYNDALKMFDSLKEMSISNEHFVYGIYLDEKCIGFVNDVDIRNNLIEIGYVIHPNMKNRGYATEALQAVIQELFRIGYTTVKAGFFEENIASKRVMEKSGMKQTHQIECIEYRGKVHRCLYFEAKVDIQQFSEQFVIRNLLPKDAVMIYEMLKHNTIFYQYHPPMVTVESILDDMRALPPGKDYEDKHYIGFFQNNTLLAVMDLIENYPDPGTAYIGFFAVNADFQGKGIGTAIISDTVNYLTQLGFEKIRLGIDNGNPQSKAFWTKNTFTLTGEEIPNDISSYLMMEREI